MQSLAVYLFNYLFSIPSHRGLTLIKQSYRLPLVL